MTSLRKTAQSGPDLVAFDRSTGLPAWVPEAARNYLAHVEGGLSIRALAREAQVAPSTILRRVRRVELSRDDPLVDAALRQLSGKPVGASDPQPAEDAPSVTAVVGESGLAALAQEAMPVLRRLSEAGTVLAVAGEMEKGVIVREGADGDPQRLGVVTRSLAEAMVLQEWIAGGEPGSRVCRYKITPQGRAVLRALVAGSSARGGAPDDEDDDDPRLRHMRSILIESPLQALSRRRDGRGSTFLSREHVIAGERLREDFELARQGIAGTEWDSILVRLVAGTEPIEDEGAGPRQARARVALALADLGPGLADVCLRCCCLLEGLEAFEERMGWSARSGKVVLRIALERLGRYYSRSGSTGSLIG